MTKSQSAQIPSEPSKASSASAAAASKRTAESGTQFATSKSIGVGRSGYVSSVLPSGCQPIVPLTALNCTIVPAIATPSPDSGCHETFEMIGQQLAILVEKEIIIPARYVQPLRANNGRSETVDAFRIVQLLARQLLRSVARKVVTLVLQQPSLPMWVRLPGQRLQAATERIDTARARDDHRHLRRLARAAPPLIDG